MPKLVKKQKIIRIFGDLSYGSGFNTALRGLVQSLETIGYTPENLRVIAAMPSSCRRELEPNDWLNSYVFQDWPHEKEDINIVFLGLGMMDRFYSKGHYNIAYTAWETDRLPSITWKRDGKDFDCVQALNLYEEIWTPTTHVKEVLIKSGVTKPIHVVRHALQKQYLDVDDITKPQLNKTRFYTIGCWNARKNIEGVIRAYLETGWLRTSPIHLTCQSTPMSRGEGPEQQASWISQEGIKNLYLSHPNPEILPPLSMISILRRYEDIQLLHQTHDVFVTASRGEGFCLPVVEALACGNTVVAGGPWLNDLYETTQAQGIYKLPYRKVPIIPVPECRGYEIHHKWWESDFDDLVHAMKEAHKHVEILKKGYTTKLSNAGKLVREHYSPKAVGDLIKTRIEWL
jgi:glycosyltransferase involved in cell wall biosynthesis